MTDAGRTDPTAVATVFNDCINGQWTAAVRDGKVAQWRVYTDTPENRERLAADQDRPPDS